MAKVLALEQATSPVLSWQVHPARERWKAALLAAAVIAIAAWLVAELMEQPAWGLFAAAVLVVGCNRFFFPTTYELTTDGIIARYPLKTIRYQWPELRRFVYDQTGGFLSPRARRSFLDEYRGMSLLFGRGDNAALIIQEIRSRMPKEAIVREVTQRKARVAGVERSEPPDSSAEHITRGAPLRSDPSHPHRKEPTCGG